MDEGKRDFGSIFLVHGSFDGSENEEGARWWQTGSSFVELLETSISEQHATAELRRFMWSGENSEETRRAAAIRLANELQSEAHKTSQISIIAHSHGGNIVRGALEKLPESWNTPVSVVSVATPFFRYGGQTSLPTRWRKPQLVLQRGLFEILPCISVPVLIWLIFSSLASRAENQAYDLVWLLLAVLGSAMIFLTPFATVYALWRAATILQDVRQPSAPKLDSLQWECVHSKNDEAIMLLNWIAQPKPVLARFFKPAASEMASVFPTLEGLRTARFILVAMLLLAPFISHEVRLAVGTLIPILDLPIRALSVSLVSLAGSVTQIEFALILIVPLVLGLMLTMAFAVFAWKLSVKLVELLSYPTAIILRLPFVASQWLFGVTIAFGHRGLGASIGFLDRLVFQRIALHVLGDDCRAKISSISDTPWDLIGTTVSLPEDLHSQFEAHVTRSYTETGALARDRIGRVASVLDQRPWAALSDVMSWSELAHTAYFREAGVSRFIVGRLLCLLDVPIPHRPTAA